MKQQIKNRYSGAVMFECEIPDNISSGLAMRYAFGQALNARPGIILRCADLSRSNLSDSDLSDSDLRGCDLSGCDLRNCDLRDSDGEPLPRATPDQAIESLDKVREIILDDSARLEMRHWHGNSNWRDRTCAEETLCGTTHCLAGWLQVCTTEPALKGIDPALAGRLAAPIAGKMFYRSNQEALTWLETRAYVGESEERQRRDAKRAALKAAA